MVKTLLSSAGGVGLILKLGANMSHPHGQKKTQNINQKQYRNKYNKDFKKVQVKRVFKKETVCSR